MVKLKRQQENCQNVASFVRQAEKNAIFSISGCNDLKSHKKTAPQGRGKSDREEVRPQHEDSRLRTDCTLT